MLIKDAQKTWVVCETCKAAFDIRKGGRCKCDNVKAAPLKDRDGAVMVVADDSDAVVYDNEK